MTKQLARVGDVLEVDGNLMVVNEVIEADGSRVYRIREMDTSREPFTWVWSEPMLAKALEGGFNLSNTKINGYRNRLERIKDKMDFALFVFGKK